MRCEQNTDFKFNSFFMGSVEFSSQTCWQPQTRDRALDNNPTCVVGSELLERILYTYNTIFEI